MGLFGIIKNKSPPDELPKLVVDEIEEKKLPLTDTINSSPEKINENPKPIEKINEIPVLTNSKIEEVENPEKKEVKIIHKEEREHKKEIPLEESYVTELEENINKELTDLNKLEGWYKNKFLPTDIVSEMRKHWEDKGNGSVIRILGKNFQSRITEKTEKMHELEKEWQNIYFDLIEKEEEIRLEEKELKKLLAEFVEMCRRKNKEKQEKEKTN